MDVLPHHGLIAINFTEVAEFSFRIPLAPAWKVEATADIHALPFLLVKGKTTCAIWMFPCEVCTAPVECH